MSGFCVIKDCDRLAVARGWCYTHYSRWRRTGDPTLIRQAQNRAPIPPGTEFGMLKVIGMVGVKGRGNRVYRCQCRCGQFSNVEGRKLKSGHTRSCGCLSPIAK